GRYPDTLGPLISDADTNPWVLLCPEDEDHSPSPGTTPTEMAANFASEKHSSYIYYGKGPVNPVLTNRVIAHDRVTNHDAPGINVLYGDGHVDWIEGPS